MFVQGDSSSRVRSTDVMNDKRRIMLEIMICSSMMALYYTIECNGRDGCDTERTWAGVKRGAGRFGLGRR